MGIHTTTNSNDQNTVICIAHKRLKGVAMRCVLRAVNASKCICGRGSATDPAGELMALPQTPSWIRDEGVRKGKEGDGGEGKPPEQKFWLRTC